MVNVFAITISGVEDGEHDNYFVHILLIGTRHLNQETQNSNYQLPCNPECLLQLNNVISALETEKNDLLKLQIKFETSKD